MTSFMNFGSSGIPTGNKNNNTVSMFMFGSQDKTTGGQFYPQGQVQPFQSQINEFNNPATIFGNHGAGTTNTGLFGQKTNTGTGLFGATGTTFGQATTPTSAFGTGIFGQTTNTTANTTNSWLNPLDKPATPATGFGDFGQSATSTNQFGQPASTPATTLAFGTGIFDQQANTGTGTIRFDTSSIRNTPAANSTRHPFSFGSATTPTDTISFQIPYTNNQHKIQPLPTQNNFNFGQQPQPQSIFGKTANPTDFYFQPTPPPAFSFGVPQQQFARPQQQRFFQPQQQQFFQSQQQQFYQPQQQRFFYPPQPFIPQQQQFVWNPNGLVTAKSQAQVPTAITQDRYPSNLGPQYNSHLSNWAPNALSVYPLYASSVNDRLQSHLLPIGSDSGLHTPKSEFMTLTDLITETQVVPYLKTESTNPITRRTSTITIRAPRKNHLSEIIAGLNLRPEVQACLETYILPRTIAESVQTVVPEKTDDQNSKLPDENPLFTNPASWSNSRRKTDQIPETTSNEKVPRMSQNEKSSSEKTTELGSPGSGISLKNPKMFTWPNIKHLDRVATETSCLVTDFVVGHEDHGKIIFPGITDVRNANLDEIFQFKNKGIAIYPVGTEKPQFGKGFNRPSKITLLEVWPAGEATKKDIRTGNKLEAAKFTDFLEYAVKLMKGNFVSYEHTTGTWSFNLEGPPQGAFQIY